MNVVGKVGSLITQGVYSVATPFHPFGGAVDVIVVQQQDGSFRSTPWYVRFGKFQGVLKGAEKVVRINVNGIEANFNMYLDNSGEAYFIREVESGKGSHTNGTLKDSQGSDVICEDGSSDDRDKNAENISEVLSRLEHSVSDSGVDRLREERGALSAIKLHRAESDGDQRYYEFQDEQSSFGTSVELSEFESSSYENGDHGAELQGLDSEVVLVSVDGHVLTAPVSASEQNTDVQSTTPQFHLGPGEETEEFNSGDETWATDYISKLNVSTSSVESTSVYEQQMKVCEGDGEHVCQHQESQNSLGPECDIQIQSDSEDPSFGIKKEEVFKSCLELSDLAESAIKADIQVDTSLQGAEDSKGYPIPAIGPNQSTVRSTNESLSPPPISDPSENENPLEFANGSLSLPHVSDQSENESHLNFANESFSQSLTYHANENGSLENANGSVTPQHVSDSTAYEESPAPEIKVIENKALDIVQSANDRSVEHPSGSNIDTKLKNEEFRSSVSSRDLNSGLQVPEECSSKNEIVEPETAALTNDMQSGSNFSFEVSLCGKELCVGMGLDEAAKVFEAHHVSAEEFRVASKSIIKDENLVIRYKKRYFPWEKVAPNVLGMAAFGLDLDVDPKDAICVEQTDSHWSRDDDAVVVTPTSSGGRKWRLWPIPFRRVKTMDHSNSNASSEDIFLDTESGIESSNAEPNSVPFGTSESPRKQLVRTNVPTSEQIASLNLKDGQNTIIFSFSTRVLGTQQVEAHIYLWKWNTRIVISDVDGTITKSDVLGQFMPLVGKDWSQSGVAKLFSAIKENGYQLLFLSARAIVQAYLTKNFLFNLNQDGKTLPNGPVVISPDGLFPSLYREVIRRAPHEFKIACLEDIRRLFPADYNPFYAGFGNRDTDELSYRKIGIPKGKIFIINPKGEVAVSRHCIDVKSYTSLHTLVNDMFPPTSLVEQEDYNSWNFWRVPLPDIEL